MLSLNVYYKSVHRAMYVEGVIFISDDNIVVGITCRDSSKNDLVSSWCLSI